MCKLSWHTSFAQFVNLPTKNMTGRQLSFGRWYQQVSKNVLQDCVTHVCHSPQDLSRQVGSGKVRAVQTSIVIFHGWKFTFPCNNSNSQRLIKTHESEEIILQYNCTNNLNRRRFTDFTGHKVVSLFWDWDQRKPHDFSPATINSDCCGHNTSLFLTAAASRLGTARACLPLWPTALR